MTKSTHNQWPIARLLAGLALFSSAYALINQRLLIEAILYRAAAYDYDNAAVAAACLAAQASLLLLATTLLPRKWFTACMILVALSAGINMIYGQIVGDVLDLQKTGWLFTEARQAGGAANEFAALLGLALGKMVLAIILLISARRILRGILKPLMNNRFSGRISAAAIITLLLSPSLIWPVLGLYPLAAERNVYSFAATILTADPPPQRAAVAALPQKNADVKKIIWLVDESVSHDGFTQIIAPEITHLDPVDFGETASMGHCSTPSNVALRSGVNVRNIRNTTDLRRTASIWRYAAKAGYATMMIDGQVSGAPQNLLLPPERALIENYKSAANGIKTDLEIAHSLNTSLKTDGKQFVYAILRGVHFQYRDHYPAGTLPEGSSTQAQYEAAIAYSKAGFFEALLDGVNRSEVAIFYTSDHGQNIVDGVTPHCSGSPVPAEFAVPLIAFLPLDIQANYQTDPGRRSHSQLFPTTLSLMGYDTGYASKRYDNILTVPTARYVWFGRGVVPVKEGGTIDVESADRFPLR